MAEPITNLQANWVAGVGIQLSWTAATDVTNESSYELYVLTPSPTTGVFSYVLYSNFKPVPTRVSGAPGYTLVAPAANVLLPWSYVLQLGKIDGIAKGLDNTTPLCISIAIVHVDASGAESDQMTVSAFPAQVFAPDNVPHLKNQFVIDQFGQVMINTQDSYDEIADSVGIVVGTEVGQRPMVPSFGVQDLPLTQIDTAAVEQAIQYWEPRANANVTVRYDENNNAALSVQINPGV